MRDLAFSPSNFAARRRRDLASIASLRCKRSSAQSIERAIVGTPAADPPPPPLSLAADRAGIPNATSRAGSLPVRIEQSPPRSRVSPRDRLNARSSGPPPRILLRRRFPEPPIAPEFQTRRLARVLYRSESSNRRREVAFRRAIVHTGHAVSI